MSIATNSYVPGLGGIIAAQTRLSNIDGEAGELLIGGFPVEELANRASFEETVYLLWHDALPNAGQLADFSQALVARRGLPDATLTLLREAAVQKVHTMDALRMAAATLSLRSKSGAEDDNPEQDAMTVVAAFPTIAAAYWRLLQGEEPVAPDPSLGHAANYLYMLFDHVPSDDRARDMGTYLNTVVDHGLNASTFTARVIISTQSDMISAVVGAVGALKGPLHGGAPGPALDMVFEIGEISQAESYLRSKLEQGDRLMGFGHRVYKVRDPRAEVLSAAAERLYKADGDITLYNLAREVEKVAVRLLDEYKPGRHLQTNVEFYTALLLHGVGLPADLFSPTFAVSRAGGWTAHCLEQSLADRLIRPRAEYIGVKDRHWVPIEKR